MTKEDSVWWYQPSYKKTFLENFRLTYPRSCDGKRPESKAKGKTVKSVNVVSSAFHKQKKASRPSMKSKKNESRNAMIVVAIIVVVIYCINRLM